MSKSAVLAKPGKTGQSWRLRFYDHLDAIRWLTLYRDKATSETAKGFIEDILAYRRARRTLTPEMLNFLDGNKAIREKLAQWGIIDKLTAAAVDDIRAILEKWKAARQTAGTELTTYKRTVAIISACRCHSLNDITPDKVRAFLNNLETAGRALRTIRHYLTAINIFFNWAVKEGYTTHNPLKGIETKNPDTDPRYSRRALTADERAALLTQTERDGKTHHGLTAHERTLIYRLALESGFRWNEIRTLSRCDVDTAAATVSVKAANAKNRRADCNPISADLANDLAAYMAERPAMPTAALFPGMWQDKGAAMIGKDLTAAGIATKNEQGEILDFHSLRHTLATELARAGVVAQAAQSVMRHASITTTQKHYTHILIDDKRTALDRAAITQTATALTVAKTGTLDAPESGISLNAEQTAQSAGNRCNHSCNHSPDFERIIRTYKNGESTGNGQINNPLSIENKGLILARPAGLKPAACGLENHRTQGGNHLENQTLISNSQNPLLPLSQPQGGNPQTNTDENGGAPLTADTSDTTAGINPQDAQNAPQSGAENLVEVITALRADLAAQRAENATLRETLNNLTAMIATLTASAHKES